MLGLEKEIVSRRKGRKSNPNEKFSIPFIAALIDKPYMTVKKKFERNSFSITEQWAIFRTLIPQEQQTMELLEYLFTEQN